MTTQQTQPGPEPHEAWAYGGTVFAGVLMVMNGILAIIQGISAIASDDVYHHIGQYVYKANLNGWGWILLILGVIVAITGVGVLKGFVWARAVGIILASLSMVAQFMFLPYSPLWSLIMIGIDFFVIWSLATYHPYRKTP